MTFYSINFFTDLIDYHYTDIALENDMLHCTTAISFHIGVVYLLGKY